MNPTTDNTDITETGSIISINSTSTTTRTTNKKCRDPRTQRRNKRRWAFGRNTQENNVPNLVETDESLRNIYKSNTPKSNTKGDCPNDKYHKGHGNYGGSEAVAGDVLFGALEHASTTDCNCDVDCCIIS